MAEAKKTKLRKKRTFKHTIVKTPEPLVVEQPAERPLETESILQTTEAQPENRMMRYGRNPVCPKCDAHPVICMMRRPKYMKFRCRVCGYGPWEVFE